MDGLLNIDPNDINSLLALYGPSEEDRKRARSFGLLQAGLALMGTPKGREMQGIGQAGLLGTNAYLGELNDAVKQRGQGLTQALGAQNLLRRDKFMREFDTPGTSGGVPQAMPQQGSNSYGPGVSSAFGIPYSPQQSPQQPPQSLKAQLQAMGVPDIVIQSALASPDPATAISKAALEFSQPRSVGDVLYVNGKPVSGLAKKDTLPIQADASGNLQARPIPGMPEYFARSAGLTTGAESAAKLPYQIETATDSQGRQVRGYAPNVFGQPPTEQPQGPAMAPTMSPDQRAVAMRDYTGQQPLNTARDPGSRPGTMVGPSPVELKAAEGKVASAQAQDTEIGKSFGDIYTGAVKSEFQAPSNISKFEQLKSHLSKVETGKLAPTVQNLKAVAAYVAPDLAKEWTKETPYAQAASSLANEMALQLRNPASGGGMPGSLSDADRQFLASMTASVGNDPRAIPLMLDARIALEKRNQEVGKMARQYRMQNGKIDEGFFQVVQDFADKNTIFKQAQTAASASGALTPAEQAELTALRKRFGR